MHQKLSPLYGFKVINTFDVNGSYVITLHSVFVQVSGALDTLPLYINYELLFTEIKKIFNHENLELYEWLATDIF